MLFEQIVMVSLLLAIYYKISERVASEYCYLLCKQKYG